ncbi:uncharacterized protein G2W53_007357 [Senna tora]|uniref:Uncharacterized protein n=1 Tax=Senna tora TaxID=362788 RepID=A0A835CFL4_9FABA|nr:uncharacterized protein G2W53_007357 [Senna tora]
MEMCVNRNEGEARVWVLDYWEEFKKCKEVEERYKMQGRLLKKSLDAAKNREKELEKMIGKLRIESHELVEEKLPNRFLYFFLRLLSNIQRFLQ